MRARNAATRAARSIQKTVSGDAVVVDRLTVNQDAAAVSVANCAVDRNGSRGGGKRPLHARGRGITGAGPGKRKAAGAQHGIGKVWIGGNIGAAGQSLGKLRREQGPGAGLGTRIRKEQGACGGVVIDAGERVAGKQGHQHQRQK